MSRSGLWYRYPIPKLSEIEFHFSEVQRRAGPTIQQTICETGIFRQPSCNAAVQCIRSTNTSLWRPKQHQWIFWVETALPRTLLLHQL